jgi:hypothetical protein
VLNRCGLIIHQTYNQLLPAAEEALAAQARRKDLLGYHDIRVGNQPDDRLRRFITHSLPAVLADMRPRWEAYSDLLEHYARGRIDYTEFAARVRRREAGEIEDNDWGEWPGFDDWR